MPRHYQLDPCEFALIKMFRAEKSRLVVLGAMQQKIARAQAEVARLPDDDEEIYRLDNDIAYWKCILAVLESL